MGAPCLTCYLLRAKTDYIGATMFQNREMSSSRNAYPSYELEGQSQYLICLASAFSKLLMSVP